MKVICDMYVVLMGVRREMLRGREGYQHKKKVQGEGRWTGRQDKARHGQEGADGWKAKYMRRQKKRRGEESRREWREWKERRGEEEERKRKTVSNCVCGWMDACTVSYRMAWYGLVSKNDQMDGKLAWDLKFCDMISQECFVEHGLLPGQNRRWRRRLAG